MVTVQKLSNPKFVCRVWSKEERDTKIVLQMVTRGCVWFFGLVQMKYHCKCMKPMVV